MSGRCSLRQRSSSSGTTTVIDNVFDFGLSSENFEAIIQAYNDAGLRAVVCPGIADIGPEETFPGVEELKQPMKGCAELLAMSKAYLKGNSHQGLVRIGLGPSRPQRCTDELLIGLLELAERDDAVIHTHLFETKYQAARGAGTFCSKIEKAGFLIGKGEFFPLHMEQ